MPTKRIFDASGGVVSVIESDDLAKTTTIAQYQDCTPIFEQNKKLLSADDGYTSHDKWRRRVASVPFITLQIWCKQWGLPFLYVWRNWKRDPAIKKWLRDRIYDADNACVLTAPHKR
jgi:hypothetical protein